MCQSRVTNRVHAYSIPARSPGWNCILEEVDSLVLLEGVDDSTVGIAYQQFPHVSRMERHADESGSTVVGFMFDPKVL